MCSVALMPPAHALALRLLLQLGVQPAWLQQPIVVDAAYHPPPLASPPPESAYTDTPHPPSNSASAQDLLGFLLPEVAQAVTGHSLPTTPREPGGGAVGEEGRGGGLEGEVDGVCANGVGEVGLPAIGEPGVPEVLLKALHPMRVAGQLMEVEAARRYMAVCRKGFAARCHFTAAHFGDLEEAHFWATLPHAIKLLSLGSAGYEAFWGRPARDASSHSSSKGQRDGRGREGDGEGAGGSAREPAGGEGPEGSSGWARNGGVAYGEGRGAPPGSGGAEERERGLPLPLEHPTRLAPGASAGPGEGGGEGAEGSEDLEEWGDPVRVRERAVKRLTWHSSIAGVHATQRRIHECVVVGDFEAAVTLLLATPWDQPQFYQDAMRAVALASQVSPAMHNLAVKVVATNMVLADQPLVAAQMLCSIGHCMDACAQLQAVGRWVDAAVLAATQLSGADRAKVLRKWAQHTLVQEQEMWRALSLFVAAGCLSDALEALRTAHQADTAMMLLLACHEISLSLGLAPPSAQPPPAAAPAAGAKGLEAADTQAGAGLTPLDVRGGGESGECAEPLGDLGGEHKTAAEASLWFRQGKNVLVLPGDLQHNLEEVDVVFGLFSQYERWLAHLCSPAEQD